MSDFPLNPDVEQVRHKVVAGAVLSAADAHIVLAEIDRLRVALCAATRANETASVARPALAAKPKAAAKKAASK